MVDKCSVAGCDKPVKTGGPSANTLCSMHYSRLQRHGDPEVGARPLPRMCSVDGCSNRANTRDLCKKHEHRRRRYGDPLLGEDRPDGAAMRWLEAHAGYHGPECLIWPFYRDRGGYGALRVGGKALSAHRTMTRLAHGDPPDPKMQAAHSCNNGHLACVNPDHLRWATRAENFADRPASRRRVTLTAANVIEIRERLAKGEPMSLIAAAFGARVKAISAIKNGRSWRSVTTS